MRDPLPQEAAHALAGGGAGALREVFGEGTLRAAFAAGLDSVSVAAGSTAVVSAVPVLALVRKPTQKTGQRSGQKIGVTGSASRALTEERTASRG
ncbi:hypothetical protein J7F04_01985 [Streptomyces sp. ISL-24]|nr:hypothetical protein [Streptomyces sp. ISL-24]